MSSLEQSWDKAEATIKSRCGYCAPTALAAGTEGMGCHGYGYTYRQYGDQLRSGQVEEQVARCNKLVDKCLNGAEGFYNCTTSHNVDCQRQKFHDDKNKLQRESNKYAQDVHSAYVMANRAYKTHQKATRNLNEQYKTDKTTLSITTEQAAIYQAHTSEVGAMVDQFRNEERARRAAYQQAVDAIQMDLRNKVQHIQKCAQQQACCLPKCDNSAAKCQLDAATKAKSGAAVAVANQNLHKLCMEYAYDRELLAYTLRRKQAQAVRYYRVKTAFLNARYLQQHLELYRLYRSAYSTEKKNYSAAHHAAFDAWRFAKEMMEHSNLYLCRMKSAVVEPQNCEIVDALQAEQCHLSNVIKLLQCLHCKAFMCGQQKRAVAMELAAAQQACACSKKSTTVMNYDFCEQKVCVCVCETAKEETPVDWSQPCTVLACVSTNGLDAIYTDLTTKSDCCSASSVSAIDCNSPYFCEGCNNGARPYDTSCNCAATSTPAYTQASCNC